MIVESAKKKKGKHHVGGTKPGQVLKVKGKQFKKRIVLAQWLSWSIIP